MKPMLEITTVAAQYEYHIERARLEISQPQPQVERTTQRASLNMRQESGRFEMDSIRRRSDMGFKGVVDRAEHEGERGLQAAQDATGTYAEIGNQLAKISQNANIPDTLWGHSSVHNKGELVLMPLSPVEIQYMPAKLHTTYQPGSLRADWNINKAQLDFVPGSFSLVFQQYASIDIEYIGGFNYVPPSSAPDFDAMA